MKRLALALLLCVIFPVSVMAAGSCVFDFQGDPSIEGQAIWTCTADASGNISSPTMTGPNPTRQFTGRIDRVQIVSGAGLSAGSIYLYAGSDTTDDILGSLGSAVNTSSGYTLTDAPVTGINGFVRKMFKETLTPYGTGLGNGGVITLKVLIVRPKP